MRMNLLCFVHSIAHTNGITGKIKQRKRNKTIIFLLTNQCSFLTLQNKFGEQKPTVFLLNGVYFLKSHLRPKLEELLLWFVLLESLFCWGQKEGGRGSRRKKENDEEEAIPEEGELKRGHRLQALQGGVAHLQWTVLNIKSMPHGQIQENVTRKLLTLASGAPFCLSNAFLPSNPESEVMAQQSIG